MSVARSAQTLSNGICIAVTLCMLLTTACAPNPTPQPTATPITPWLPLVFSGDNAYDSVVRQVALGPRITGTAPNRQLGDQILAELAANGWSTETQVFNYHNTVVRNIVGAKGAGDHVIILGAHYDTRRRADRDANHPDQPVPGADDGGSGTGILLELSRVLNVEKTSGQVRLVFFDAEDNGELDGWDWLAGSRYYANSLTITPTAVVVMDMVGDAQQEIYFETNSTPALKSQIWAVASSLGFEQYFIPRQKWNMTDDHTPFLDRGWPAVDIIDFDYPYWHTTQDTPDKISPESLQRVGRTLQVWLEGSN